MSANLETKANLETNARDGEPAEWSLAKAYGFRFFIIYTLLYVFPFPLVALPYVGETLNDWAMKPFEPLTRLVGEHLLGMASPLRFGPNGSGDTSKDYALVVLFLIVAAVAAAVWTAVSKRRPHTLLPSRFRMLLRWSLGYMLLNYGSFKVFPLQFSMPNDFRITQPLGDFSPMGIAWAFIGSSPAYEIFTGVMEVVAGLLLLTRRTSTVGALFAAAVLTNIVALNFCYDIPVKLLSSHLLLFAVVVAMPEARRLFGALILGRAVGPGFRERPFASRWMERLRVPFGLAMALYICATFAINAAGFYRRANAPAPPGS